MYSAYFFVLFCGLIDLEFAAEFDDGRGIAQTLAGVKDIMNQTAIHTAAREGMVNICKFWINDLKLEVDPKDAKGYTPLHCACEGGHLSTAEYLLKKGADPNIRNDRGFTPLHFAAENGREELLRLLLSKGVDVDALSSVGTPLQMAACKGKHEAVKILLDHCANPGLYLHHVPTPLSGAVLAKSLSSVELLIAADADPDAVSCGVTPLHLAASEGQTEIIKCLLKAGADPDLTDEDGMRPVEVAALNCSHQDVMILHPVTSPIPRYPEWSVNGIMKHVRSEEASTVSKSQQLLEAASTGNLELFKSLVAELDDGKGLARTVVDIKDYETGQTALHIAVINRKMGIYQYLVKDLKLDVELKDGRGDTPLHHVALNGYFLGAYNFLQEYGASLDPRNHLGVTPLHYAASGGGKEHRGILRMLLSKGVDVNVGSDLGTPLNMAASKGNLEEVSILLNHHADPNKYSHSMYTPLSSSILAPSLACMLLLIEAGADPNASSFGGTPLVHAALERETEMIKCLLKAGADPDVTNDFGLTPLEIAALNGSHQDAQILYPVTSPIQKYSDWSIHGLMSYLRSEEAREQRALKAMETFEERKSKAKDAFHKKDYLGAELWYSKALELEPRDALLLSNRSLCRARLKNGDSALSDAEACLMFKPKWPKAHYRAGAACIMLGKFDRAVDEFSKGLKLAPENEELQNALQEAREAKMKSTMV
ncbi:Ankyrin-1 [Thalictrum thalictroides]|uniref:Ankyrin-1 n=1 Tax=Thalictrum thalictroides TaxID=46969 RepID=A0A7J6VMS7_THATH|nr:Ankyrin-1 [Thalictrum thalictroides]